MTIQDEIVECLRRKGCPMSVARLAEEFKKPPQVIEANLALLRREGRVQILRPGEWEIAPEKPAAAELIPPAPAVATVRPQLTTEAAARAIAEDRLQHEMESRHVPAAATDHQETTMSYKTCEKCKGKKGPRAFDKGKAVCRECQGGKRQGGGSAEACEWKRQRTLPASDRFAARRARQAHCPSQQDRYRDRADRGAGLT